VSQVDVDLLSILSFSRAMRMTFQPVSKLVNPALDMPTITWTSHCSFSKCNIVVVKVDFALKCRSVACNSVVYYFKFFKPMRYDLGVLKHRNEIFTKCD